MNDERSLAELKKKDNRFAFQLIERAFIIHRSSLRRTKTSENN